MATGEEMLRQVFKIDSLVLSKHEKTLLEAEIFVRTCDEVKNIIKTQHEGYFRLMKFDCDMEIAMIDSNFMRYIINDILITEEYSLSGIAYYTQTPEDVIYEIAAGHNPSPSIALSKKIIDIHRSVRADLYEKIIRKVLEELLTKFQVS